MEEAAISMRRHWTLPAPRRWGAVAIFVVASLMATIRFPPADLMGWLAHQLGVPFGVPFVFLAGAYAAVGWMLAGERRLRVLRYVAFALAGYFALVGFLTFATPA